MDDGGGGGGGGAPEDYNKKKTKKKVNCFKGDIILCPYPSHNWCWWFWWSGRLLKFTI
jgi:hypothetical protein